MNVRMKAAENYELVHKMNEIKNFVKQAFRSVPMNPYPDYSSVKIWQARTQRSLLGSFSDGAFFRQTVYIKNV